MDTPTLYDSWHDAGISLTGIRGDATGQARTTCPNCTPHRKAAHQREKDLSLNLIDDTFFCHHCAYAGRIGQDPHRFGDSTPTSQRAQSYQAPRAIPKQVIASAAALAQEWITARGISPETTQKAQLWAEMLREPQSGAQRLTINIPFFDANGNHVNTKHRTIDDGDRAFWMEAGAAQPFYNLQDIDPAQTLIIVEGELDALSCVQAGFTNVVSVPNGAPPPEAKNLAKKLAFVDDAMELLQAVPSVIIATDGDAPGQHLQYELARRIGMMKCRRVIWPENCKDANDVLVQHSAEALGYFLKNAPVYPINGLASGIDMITDLEYAWEHGWDTGVLTGLNALDAICRFTTGYLATFTGHSGSGKSTVLDNILVGLASRSDWPIAMYSPEQMPLHRHQAQLIQIKTGKPFSREYPERMTRSDLEFGNKWISDYFSYVNPPKKRDLDTILEYIEMEVLRRGIKAWVIDPWNCIVDEVPAGVNKTDAINAAIFKMKLLAQNTNTLGCLVAHPTKLKPAKPGEPEPRPTLTDISGSINFRNQTDYGLVIHRDQGSITQRNVVEISIAKIRMEETGDAGAMARFIYDKPTSRILPYYESRDSEGVYR